MPLTIKPPRPPSEPTGVAPQPATSNDGSSSPVAPAYSPITPKVQPVLPAVGHGDNGFDVPPVPPADTDADMIHHDLPVEHSYEHVPHHTLGGKAPIPPPPVSNIPETPYMPEPPPQPFSSEDSTDAIALRAAISALQFQKQKAQGDLQALDALKKQAMQDPERFRRELVSGGLKEQRHNFGAIRDVLDAPAEDGDDNDEVMLGAQEEVDSADSRGGAEPDSQLSSQTSPLKQSTSKQSPFPPIPGPQDVVRMPPLNWEKYNIVGDPLDALHEQQRRWPGSAPGADYRGREHSVAAPYSPFLDNLDSQAQQQPQSARNGSQGTAPVAPGADQAMETRRTSKN